MKNAKKAILLVFGFCLNLNTCIYTQDYTRDSIRSWTYSKLADLFYEQINNSGQATLIANAYLRKARSEQNLEKKLGGYYFLSIASEEDSIKIQYADSIIDQSIHLEAKNELYPYLGYQIKADYYYKKRKLKPSLDNYLKAYQVAEKNNNKQYQQNSNLGIALIKSRLGYNEEALQIFKKSLDFFDSQNYAQSYPEYYLNYLTFLSESFRRNQQIDSSSYYNAYGHRLATEKSLPNFADYFKGLEGFNCYDKGQYKVSIDSITKSIHALKTLKAYPHLAESYYYLGLSNIELNNTNAAMNYFVKVDSIFNQIGEIHPNLRETYNYLINHNEKIKNSEKELFYIKQLMKLDSIYFENYRYIDNKLNLEYDTPRLLAKKNQLIKSLQKEDHKNTYVTIILVVTLTLTIVLLTYIFIKKNQQKKQFEAIIAELEEKTTKKTVSSDYTKDTSHSAINIPKEIVGMVLSKLESFEENEEYTQKNLTLSIYSKQIGSNSTYVSKIVNHYKNKNYATYLNDLRVAYAANRLKSDKLFRNYKIMTIANESGFNNSESFSKHFEKKYGMKPSIFIKKLKESNLS